MVTQPVLLAGTSFVGDIYTNPFLLHRHEGRKACDDDLITLTSFGPAVAKFSAQRLAVRRNN